MVGFVQEMQTNYDTNYAKMVGLVANNTTKRDGLSSTIRLL